MVQFQEQWINQGNRVFSRADVFRREKVAEDTTRLHNKEQLLTAQFCGRPAFQVLYVLYEHKMRLPRWINA